MSHKKQDLSAREIQVIAVLMTGQTRTQAADQLGISPHTINVHIEHIYRFLGALNIADAVRIFKSGQRSIANCP
ncbi:MAG: helix-turn-helix transcriptional regulator [Chloroflexota bacterium]